jgi:predicted MPP superfamily phosphohydrolase
MAVTRRTVLKALAVSGASALGAGGGYGYVHGRRALEITHVDLPVFGLPPSLSGFRIGLLTDVHRSRWVSAEDVAAAANLLMASRPDLIVLGGDYVTWGDRQFVGSSAEALAPLSAPHGVFGIIGNHDDDHDMPAALAAHGVEIPWTPERIDVKNETVDLVGFDSDKTRNGHPVAAPGPRGNLHPAGARPAPLHRSRSLEHPAVLSGHTHGAKSFSRWSSCRARKFPVVSARRATVRRRCSSAAAWAPSTSRFG